jgi:hypothetical protein
MSLSCAILLSHNQRYAFFTGAGLTMAVIAVANQPRDNGYKNNVIIAQITIKQNSDRRGDRTSGCAL